MGIRQGGFMAHMAAYNPYNGIPASRGNFRVMLRLGLLDPPEMVPYSNIGIDDTLEPCLREDHRRAARVEEGILDIMIGSSSADIKLITTIEIIKGTDRLNPGLITT
jgi:hypothetical protein